MAVEISTLMRRRNGTFVDYRDFGRVVEDRFTIEGAIVLVCDGVAVLDESMWDLVDQLWGYLIMGIETLQHARTWSTSFPDQPIELTIRYVGGDDRLLLSTDLDGARKAVVPKQEFFAAVATQGSAYLEWLDQTNAASNYAELQRRASRLLAPRS